MNFSRFSNEISLINICGSFYLLYCKKMLGELSNSFLICLPSISPGLEFFTGSENDPFLSIEI